MKEVTPPLIVDDSGLQAPEIKEKQAAAAIVEEVAKLVVKVKALTEELSKVKSKVADKENRLFRLKAALKAKESEEKKRRIL